MTSSARTQFEEVGVRQLLLAGQGEPFGQGIEQLAELERAQQRFEVGADRVAQHRAAGSRHVGLGAAVDLAGWTPVSALR